MTPKAQVESNSIIALVAHVMSGKWASVVPEKLAGMFVSAGAIAAVPISGAGRGQPDGEGRGYPDGEGLGEGEDKGEPVGLVMVQREPLTPLLATLSDVARQLAV